MEAAALVTAVRRDGEDLIAAAEAAAAVDVPTCPGWDMPVLVRHVSGVHRWCAAIVASGEAVRRRDMAAPGEDVTFAELAAWYREGLDLLCSTLADADPAAPAWTFSTAGQQSVAWWQRRMAAETSVHRWDAQHAGGPDAAQPIAADVAVEGIAEYFGDFLPRTLEQAGVALHGTLHLHATDDVEGGEWLVDFDTSPLSVSAGHAKADTAIRGPASDLMLWLWNRLAGGGSRLEVFGSPEPLTAWPRLVL